jgi:hypothetical protein
MRLVYIALGWTAGVVLAANNDSGWGALTCPCAGR